MSRPRRSNRASGARTKYIHDPFEAVGFLSDEENTSSATPQPKKDKGKAKRAAADESSDGDFNMDDANEDDDDDEYNDNDVEMANENEDEDEEEEEADNDDDDDDASVSEVDQAVRRRKQPLTTTTPKTVKKRRPDGSLAVPGEETHSRGSWNPLEHVGKGVHLRVTFGSDERDILSIISARDRWYRGGDSTFPSQSSLDESQDMPDYGYGKSFGLDPEDVKRERSRGWDWYYGEDVGQRFRKRQRIERIDEHEARAVYFPRSRGKHNVLVGPVDGQKVFSLAQHEGFDFGEAWGEDTPKQEKQDGKRAKTKSESRKRRKREGWIFNIGSKVQCLAWVPNQTGLTQYLSVVAPILPDQKEQCPDPYKDQGAPAFRPSAPYPSVLQLWVFKAERAESLTKTIDMTFKPRLRLALCTEWGDLRRIAWCPMPRDPREEDDDDAQKNVGLLAGIWSDGCVRVVDVKLGRDPNQTEFYKLHSPVFEAKPPSTVCTSITWLSPSDIAVGCANGFVAIWSIVPSTSSPSRSQPTPYFYHQLHSTWILNLASAYPTHPYIISTTSMDGETRLTSIIDHQKDTVSANRMRVGTPHLSYSPILHSFVSSDENDFARLLAVRRFFTSTAVARLPSMISAISTCSFWHPSILVGCTGGTVQATNPLRRMMHAKEKQWQQTWFQHEWARAPDGQGPGTSRFHDGYRAEHTSLMRNLVGDPKLVNGTAVITVYDEETHITVLSWNPNQLCAGWAAAGMGCGLVRVEDLALS